MKTRKAVARSTSLVWRISELAPFGEWVDKRVQVARKSAGVAVIERYASWMSSTHDLMDGAEVSEPAGCDFDELFGRLANPPARLTEK